MRFKRVPKFDEKYLQNLRPVFSLFIYSVDVCITWQDDRVHGTVARPIYISWRNNYVRCLLY